MSPEVAEIMRRWEDEQRQREQERFESEQRQRAEAAAPTSLFAPLDPNAAVRQNGQTIITRDIRGGEVAMTVDEFCRQRPSVPPPPSIKAKPGVGWVEADCWRTWVWAQPFNKAPHDWNQINGSFPSDPQGTCRHKASYLRDRLGGRVIFGRRTDQRGAGPHAVLEIEIAGEHLIIDRDRVWRVDRAPFHPAPVPWVPDRV